MQQLTGNRVSLNGSRRSSTSAPLCTVAEKESLSANKNGSDAEQSLRENEERYRLATEAINGVIYDWDIRTGIIHRSAGLFELIGVRPEEASSEVDWWKNRMHPDDWRCASESMNRVLQNHDTVFENEYRVRHKDGRWIHIRDKGRVVYDEGGAPRRVVGCSEDITERVNARLEIAEMADRFRTLADNIGQLVWIGDHAGKPVWCNKRWMDFLAVGPDEFVWESVIARGHADLVRQVSEALAQGVDWEETLPLRGKDGTVRWFLSRVTATRDRSGAVIRWFGSHTDITELREAHAALRASIEAAEQARLEAEAERANADAANRAKDQFLAALSHELRTPLSPVMMGIDLLGRRADLPPAAAEVLAMIKRNIKLEARLIDDLLDLNRIVHGKLSFSFHPVDLHKIVQQALDVVSPQFAAKQQELVSELNATQVELSGDAGRLQQVVWNLLTNASKFTPRGGRITLRSADKSGCFCLEVIDTGIGFPPETAERIFEPFEQADLKVTKEFGGLGLGLAISNATVLAHRGKITASSRGPGKGATFRILLPLTGVPA